MEKVLRNLVSASAMLVLVESPDSLSGGFKSAWTEIITSWGAGQDAKSRLVRLLNRLVVASEGIEYWLQTISGEYV